MHSSSQTRAQRITKAGVRTRVYAHMHAHMCMYTPKHAHTNFPIPYMYETHSI